MFFGNEDFEDLYQLICPLEDFNNNNDFELQPAGSNENNSDYEAVKVVGIEEKSNIKSKSVGKTHKRKSHKRGRPRLVPLTEDLLRERRDAANARERRRMNQMTLAYLTLKEKLPNNERIVSKKQIVDQVIIKYSTVSVFKCLGSPVYP